MENGTAAVILFCRYRVRKREFRAEEVFLSSPLPDPPASTFHGAPPIVVDRVRGNSTSAARVGPEYLMTAADVNNLRNSLRNLSTPRPELLVRLTREQIASTPWRRNISSQYYYNRIRMPCRSIFPRKKWPKTSGRTPMPFDGQSLWKRDRQWQSGPAHFHVLLPISLELYEVYKRSNEIVFFYWIKMVLLHYLFQCHFLGNPHSVEVDVSVVRNSSQTQLLE